MTYNSIKKKSISALVHGALILTMTGTGCDDTGTRPGDPDSVTVTFRDGIEPLPTYYGTRDAVLRNGPSLDIQTSNRGTAPSDTVGNVEIGGVPYSRRMLIRFDLTPITDCLGVTDALLTLRFEPEDTNRTVRLDAYEAAVPDIMPGSWVEGFLDEGVSWLYADDGVTEWAHPGGDYLGLLDSRTAGADTAVTFELEAARVERWIKYPSTNNGVLIIPYSAGDEAYLHVHMRESADISLRPELIVKYTKGG